MLLIAIQSDEFCLHPNIDENVYSRAIFVTAVGRHYASFGDWQNVLPSNIFYKMPRWTWIWLIGM